MNVKLLSKNNKNLGLLTGMILLFSVSLMSATTITSTTTGGTWVTGSTWVGGIAPRATDDVIIATTGTNSVDLGANTSIFNLTINSGSTFTIANTNTLEVSGNWINNGTFNANNNSTVVFNGTAGQSIGGSSVFTLYNLTNSNTSSPLTTSVDITVNSTLSNLSSTSVIDMATFVLKVTTMGPMEGTVRFSGDSNGLAFPTGTVDYYGSRQTVQPGNYFRLLFSGNSGSYDIISNLVFVSNRMDVTAGALTVKTPFYLTVEGPVTVSTSGEVTLENNAALIQTTYTGPNSGNITVKRDTSPIVLDDYTYWSSPTTGPQTLLNFSPNTRSDKYFDFDNNFANLDASTAVFAPGVGYIIRAPEGISPNIAANYPFEFKGVPNNGTIDVPVTSYIENGVPAGLRLVGNPYPSALDADAFVEANVATGAITGSLYFWTHNHRLNGNDYVASDYAIYNSGGGVGVSNGTGNIKDPTQFIPSGQGFFIQNDITSNVTFNNTMRVGGNNSNFYKIKSTKAVERHRIWFSLSNGTSNTSQALVGYGTGATNGYDAGYDSYVYDDAQAFSFYSFIDANKMAIQTRAVPFVDTDTVRLGYSINVAGNATLTVYKYDGMFSSGQGFYLEDKLLNVIHNIKETPYNFTSQAGTFDNRFVLRYTDKTLGVNDVETTSENLVLVSNKDKKISISSFAGPIDKTIIFDATGRILYQKTNVDSKELKILELVSSKQLLLVKVVLQDGKSITKKIIY
jgi:hypothetical protein